ncbi:hypothetical protein [Streptomyces mirabilis]|uniref:hypothetical protein n=1 Tax=Streptomyces mirabilis TaxID=68239 RepID=UPI0036EF6C55
MTFTALHHRDVHGIGSQVVDVNLIEPLVRLIESATPTYDQLGTVVVRSGSRFDASAPRNCHRSKDRNHGSRCPQPRPSLRETTARPAHDASYRGRHPDHPRVAVVMVLANRAAQ